MEIGGHDIILKYDARDDINDIRKRIAEFFLKLWPDSLMQDADDANNYYSVSEFLTHGIIPKEFFIYKSCETVAKFSDLADVPKEEINDMVYALCYGDKTNEVTIVVGEYNAECSLWVDQLKEILQ